MSPVDSVAVMPAAGPGTVAALSQQQMAGGPSQTIPLSTLIEYIIQRTYHELTILSELLPRKTDMERKMEIVQFVSRTRQLFVRLLALVKWANSASKVDKCAMISNYLDQQAMRYVETADMLAKMARETLVHARLPTFSLPCAIDVLTTGTFPRLPACIKERIVPVDPITPQEKRDTLLRLNQIIEHRLVILKLPSHMRRLKIDNGRVKFYVEHEFEVTLTLMGEGSHIPWRLLDIEILVEDPETGDGKSLVHSLQVNYIHQLVQSRLIDNEHALSDLYNVLHSFCQSLQLEVLHSQTCRLIHERLGEHVRIEDYMPGKRLSVSYWRDSNRRESRYFPGATYKLKIHEDEQNPSRPLQISHSPQIQGSESIKVAQAIRSDHLSLEKLLMHTMQVRSTAKLKDLERELRCIVPGQCEIRELPSVLYVPVLEPCMLSEKLCITVDIQKGSYLVSIGEHENELTEDLEDCLNSDRRDLRKILSSIRLSLGIQRCRKTVQHMAASCHQVLPLVDTSGHLLEKLGPHKLYIRLPKQTAYYLVVEVFERDREVMYNHYLLQLLPSTYDASMTDGIDDGIQAYLRPGHMVQLDSFLCTHSLGASLFDSTPEDSQTRKRKMFMGDGEEPVDKKPKMSPYYLPELSHIAAMCEDRVPFLLLAQELQKHKIYHQGIQLDDDSVGLALTLVSMPSCPQIEAAIMDSLRRDLLSCKFRIQRKGSRIWVIESIFANCPVKSTNPKEQSKVHRVYFAYDLSSIDSMSRNVQNFIDDWASVAHLYSALHDFAAIYKDNVMFQAGLEIKTYTYKRLTLAYGTSKYFTVSVQYKTGDKKFHLAFGTCNQSPVPNPHTLLSLQLQRQLNNNHSITHLAQFLLDTWAPLCAINKLNTAPIMGANTRPNQSVTTFTMLPQSSTHIRVVFRNIYCIDVHCRGNQLVAIRDGAYSMFDTSKVVEGLTPIPGLKAFLNQFVDEGVTIGASRRRSVTEDDNPPSPVGMDTMDSFMSQPANIGSPRQRQDGLRFPGPMTPPSNPLTPASPNTRMSQQPVAPSPSSTFIGTPSPGTMLAQGSPSNTSLHVPSPGSFVPAPSPQSLGIHMPSPASQFFGSQGGSVMSPPSRMLPQRAWAASIPTILSHEALYKLLSAGPLVAAGSMPQAPCCALERFLGCVFLIRHVRRVVQTEDNLQPVQTTELNVAAFKAETLQFRVSFNPNNLQTLLLKATPAENVNQWEIEELQYLEKFFEIKVASYPYKANTMTAFGRLLSAPARILKDCLQIIRLELVPERNMKWSVQWCLTVPHGAPPIAMAGTPAVVIKGKILFMLQLTRLGVATPPGSEPQTVIVPILYDMTNNVTQIAEHRSQVHVAMPSQASVAMNNMLKRFHEYNPEPNRCSIYPAVRELIMNLVIPM